MIEQHLSGKELKSSSKFKNIKEMKIPEIYEVDHINIMEDKI